MAEGETVKPIARETEIRNALFHVADNVRKIAFDVADNEPVLHGQVFENCWLSTNKMKPTPHPEGKPGDWQTVDLDSPYVVMRVAFEVVPQGQRKGKLERSQFERNPYYCDEE